MTRKTGQLCNCGVWLRSLETLRLGHAEHTNPRDNKNIISLSAINSLLSDYGLMFQTHLFDMFLQT